MRVHLSAPGIEQSDSGDALIDSGARIGAIDTLLVSRFKLAYVDNADVFGIGGTRSTRTYWIAVRCGGHELGAYRFAAIDGLFARGLIALLGRDVLHHRVFTYDGGRGSYGIGTDDDETGDGQAPVAEEISTSRR